VRLNQQKSSSKSGVFVITGPYRSAQSERLGWEEQIERVVLGKQPSSTIGTIRSAVSVTIGANLRQGKCYQGKGKAGHYQKRRSDRHPVPQILFQINREEPERLKKMLGFVVSRSSTRPVFGRRN
jgi:hypothetical protein